MSNSRGISRIYPAILVLWHVGNMIIMLQIQSYIRLLLDEYQFLIPHLHRNTVKQPLCALVLCELCESSVSRIKLYSTIFIAPHLKIRCYIIAPFGVSTRMLKWHAFGVTIAPLGCKQKVLQWQYLGSNARTHHQYRTVLGRNGRLFTPTRLTSKTGFSFSISFNCLHSACTLSLLSLYCTGI